MTESNHLASTSSQEITSSRSFDSPRERIFKAFSDPGLLAEWWGPEGFRNTFHEFDLRPGGHWRFTMHGPDGTDYENESIFSEVAEPERIALKHVSEPPFQMTITLEDRGGKTQMTWRMHFASSEEFAAMREICVQANEQNFDRLEALLEGMPGGARPAVAALPGEPFAMSRAFDAPRDLVWKAWTEGDRLAQWLGPKGVIISECTLDLRAGGVFHYCMRTPDGHQMWGKWTFLEIEAPECLVFIVSFSDAQGGVTRHPMSATWPLETLSKVTFEDRHGKTLLAIEWTPHNASTTEQETFDATHDGMRQGWTGTLDHLTDYIAKIDGK